MGISKVGSGRKIGDIFDHAGTVAPPGAMAVPIAPTNISRALYAKLFKVIGVTWGAGDGVNTFGMPYIKPDYPTLQANGNVGTETSGAAISHAHVATQSAHSHVTYYFDQSPGPSENGKLPPMSNGNGPQTGWYAGTSAAQPPITVNPTGGANNLAAGVRLLKCIQYA